MRLTHIFFFPDFKFPKSSQGPTLVLLSVRNVWSHDSHLTFFHILRLSLFMLCAVLISNFWEETPSRETLSVLRHSVLFAKCHPENVFNLPSSLKKHTHICFILLQSFTWSLSECPAPSCPDPLFLLYRDFDLSTLREGLA